MDSSDIAALKKYTPETLCARCGRRIKKGEPRALVMLMRFHIGPGNDGEDLSHEALAQDRRDNERCDGFGRLYGLDKNSSTARAFCDPCAGEEPTITISNPWHAEREQRAADDPGGSVWAMPVSRKRIDCDDFGDDYAFMGKSDKLLPTPARTEAEDRLLSGHLTQSEVRTKREGRSPFTEEDRRHRMARFLLTPESRKMNARMRDVCGLWSEGEGMKQPEIAKQIGISQASVCRLIRDGDSRAILYSQQSGKN
jgi:hypothetical protein